MRLKGLIILKKNLLGFLSTSELKLAMDWLK
jgi:hypothetical protein